MTGNRSEHVPLRDIRRVFRLVGEICELRAQPSLQRRRMIDGLCDLIGLPAGRATPLDQFTAKQWLTMTSMILGRSPARRSLQWFARWASQVRGTGGNENPSTNGGGQPAASDQLFPDLFGPRQRNSLRLLVVELYRVHRRGDLFSQSEAARRRTDLTPRQRQVLECMLGGASVKRIAEDLGLSPRTVEEHTQVVYGRLGASSRAELMALFIEGGSEVTSAGDANRG